MLQTFRNKMWSRVRIEDNIGALIDIAMFVNILGDPGLHGAWLADK